jgi:hypothetical protein
LRARGEQAVLVNALGEVSGREDLEGVRRSAECHRDDRRSRHPVVAVHDGVAQCLPQRALRDRTLRSALRADDHRVRRERPVDHVPDGVEGREDWGLEDLPPGGGSSLHVENADVEPLDIRLIATEQHGTGLVQPRIVRVVDRHTEAAQKVGIAAGRTPLRGQIVTVSGFERRTITCREAFGGVLG